MNIATDNPDTANQTGGTGDATQHHSPDFERR